MLTCLTLQEHDDDDDDNNNNTCFAASHVKVDKKINRKHICVLSVHVKYSVRVGSCTTARCSVAAQTVHGVYREDEVRQSCAPVKGGLRSVITHCDVGTRRMGVTALGSGRFTRFGLLTIDHMFERGI